MSIAPARVLLGLVIAGIWLAVLPAVASADDCATRAARITAGQVPSNEADPDCNKAGVIGTTVAVAGASAAVGVTAVKLASGGAGGAAKPPGGQPGQGQAGGTGPVVTGRYSGPEAIDILVKSGLATPVTDASGKPVWETDPRTGQPLRYPNGDPVPKIKPLPGFDNLGGNPVARTVGQSINPQTGQTDLVQTQTITGVTGFAGNVRTDGTIDPNVAITVDQQVAPRDGFPWAPPVERPGPAAPPPQTPPQGPQTTTTPPPPTTSQTPQTQQTTPPQDPQTPPQPPQTPPQVTVPVTTPQTPPAPPQTTTPQTPPPQTAKPPVKPADVSKIPTNDNGERIPGTPDEVAKSLMAPGTTLIPTDVGGFLHPDGTIAKYPNGIPDDVKDALKGAKVDTRGGRVRFDVKLPDVDTGLTNPITGQRIKMPGAEAHVDVFAEKGKLNLDTPKDAGYGSKGVAILGNSFFNSKGGPNQQWDERGLDLRSVSTVTDPATGKTYIKVTVVPRK